MTITISAVIAALILVESGGDPNALWDYKNGQPQAVGILQIHEIYVREANRLEVITSRKENRTARVWTYSDRFNPERSIEMTRTTLGHHWRRGITDPVELAGRHRNPNGDCPKWYLKKVKKALKTLKNVGRR